MQSLQNTARTAGLLYLILAVTGIYGLMYVPSKIAIKGDAVATAHNILTNEFLYRTGIVSGLTGSILFMFLAFVLYRLLKQVNEHRAKLMVALVIVQTPVSFVLEICKITSLMILKGEVLKELEPEQLLEVSMVLRKMYSYGISTLTIFWGLWLIPFGQLICKSGFIPRILGVLLIIAGIGYMIDSFTFLLFPDDHAIVSRFTIVIVFGELPIIFWLLIKGVKGQPNVSV